MQSRHLISNTNSNKGLRMLFPPTKIKYRGNLFGELTECNETSPWESSVFCGAQGSLDVFLIRNYRSVRSILAIYLSPPSICITACSLHFPWEIMTQLYEIFQIYNKKQDWVSDTMELC